MYSVEIPKGINNIISLFCRIGIWHRGDVATVRETRIKIFYTVSYLVYAASLMTGTFESQNQDEAIFLADIAIARTYRFVDENVLYNVESK